MQDFRVGIDPQVLLTNKSNIMLQICAVLWAQILFETVFSAIMLLENSIVLISFEFVTGHRDHYIIQKTQILLGCVFASLIPLVYVCIIYAHFKYKLSFH